MMSRRDRNSVRTPPGPPATTTGSTPQCLTAVTPPVKTGNKEEESHDVNFIFEPPSSRNPWDLVPRWPVTHGERVAELQFQASHYNKTDDALNVQAAIAWHSKFPHDQLVGRESVCFQRGVIVNEDEVNLQEGPVWDEGPPDDNISSWTDVLPTNIDQYEDADFEFDPPDSREPSALVPKWPATHRHRIAELNYQATFYNTVGHADNIKAAKAWHAKFPLDDLIGHEICYFHRGQEYTDLSKISLEESRQSPVWVEAPPAVLMMSGHGSSSKHTIDLLKP